MSSLSGLLHSELVFFSCISFVRVEEAAAAGSFNHHHHLNVDPARFDSHTSFFLSGQTRQKNKRDGSPSRVELSRAEPRRVGGA